MAIEWTAYGPDAVLLRFATKTGEAAFRKGQAIAAELEENPPLGLVEYVPAFTTVLLEFESRERDRLAHTMTDLVARLNKLSTRRSKPAPPKEIPVRYDGPDLERVAKKSGLSVPEVCRRHSARVYKVYMLGFAPGFPYLGDLDTKLHTPRLDSPRPRVAAGSVAIGGSHTGIYSVDSPGGWNIIGHTTVVLVQTKNELQTAAGQEIFHLKPGDQVKFVT